MGQRLKGCPTQKRAILEKINIRDGDLSKVVAADTPLIMYPCTGTNDDSGIGSSGLQIWYR